MRTAIILTCLFAAFAVAGETATVNNDVDEFLKSYDFNKHLSRPMDRDQWVHVWFGNLSGEPVNAEINERVYLDVFIETSDSAYGADILLVLGTDNRYIDSLLSESEAQLFYPFNEWPNVRFREPYGSPPNPEGWSSQSFLGFALALPPNDIGPWLHLETPQQVLTMVVKTANDSTLIGQTVEAFATGLDNVQGLPNCGDTTAMIAYSITQYFSPLHFEGGGMFEGTVTDDNSNPIAGAIILDTVTLTGDTTDSNGEYYIPDLYPGLHSIQVTHISYIDTVISDITIITDQTTTLNIELNPSGYLTGTVTNSETTAPLAGVSITAVNSSQEDTAIATTESDGSYFLDNIHPGYYHVSFELDLYRDTTLTDTNVIALDPTYLNVAMVRIPQNDVGVTAILSPVDSIANDLDYDCIVQITNYQIDAVSFDVVFEVYFEDSSEVTFADTFGVVDMPDNSIDTVTFTDQFEPSAPAVYNIIAYTLLDSELDNGNDSTNISVICYAWGCIDGLVTNSPGNAIQNVFVKIDSTDFECLTDSTGYYFLDIVPIGPWDLSFTHPDYNDTIITDVLVQLEDTTGLDVEMHGWGDISGTVTDRSGNAISDVYVEIVNTDMGDTTGVTGQYLFEDIEIGTHTLLFSHPNYDDTTISNVLVQHDETTVLNVVLYDWGNLTGTVIDESEDPIENVQIRVVGSSIITTTDSTGEYVINDIPGGTHNIRFSHSNYYTVIVPDVLIAHDSTTIVDLTMESSVGIDDLSSIPEEYSIDQNYPNPFNAITSFEYALPEDAYVTIIIFDILGHQVATLISQHQPAGYHHVSWDAGANSSGIYFYRTQAGDFAKTKKMILLK